MRRITIKLRLETVRFIWASVNSIASVIIKQLFSWRIMRPLISVIFVTGRATAFCILPVHLITQRLALVDPVPIGA